MAWTSLCELDELKEGEGRYVEIGGFQLGVFMDQGKVFVTDNTCPHVGHGLSGGHIDEGCIVCPWHSWAFCLENGQLRGAPGVAIGVYKTRVVQPEGRPKLVQADLPIY